MSVTNLEGAVNLGRAGVWIGEMDLVAGGVYVSYMSPTGLIASSSARAGELRVGY